MALKMNIWNKYGKAKKIPWKIFKYFNNITLWYRFEYYVNIQFWCFYHNKLQPMENSSRRLHMCISYVRSLVLLVLFFWAKLIHCMLIKFTLKYFSMDRQSKSGGLIHRILFLYVIFGRIMTRASSSFFKYEKYFFAISFVPFSRNNGHRYGTMILWISWNIHKYWIDVSGALHFALSLNPQLALLYISFFEISLFFLPIHFCLLLLCRKKRENPYFSYQDSFFFIFAKCVIYLWNALIKTQLPASISICGYKYGQRTWTNSRLETRDPLHWNTKAMNKKFYSSLHGEKTKIHRKTVSF